MVGASQVWGLHSKEIAWNYDTRFTALMELQESAGEAYWVNGIQNDINTQLDKAKNPQYATLTINKALGTKLSEIFIIP